MVDGYYNDKVYTTEINYWAIFNITSTIQLDHAKIIIALKLWSLIWEKETDVERILFKVEIFARH